MSGIQRKLLQQQWIGRYVESYFDCSLLLYRPEEAPEQEPWLLALLATQLGLLVTVVIFRRHTGFTAAVFALSGTVMLSSLVCQLH